MPVAGKRMACCLQNSTYGLCQLLYIILAWRTCNMSQWVVM